VSGLIVAAVLLAGTVTVLWPRRRRARPGESGFDPLSQRAIRHLLDDDPHQLDGKETGGSL